MEIRSRSACLITCALAALIGCSDDNNGNPAGTPDSPTSSTKDSPVAVPDGSATALLSCDDSMKNAFKPDGNTTVTLVKLFHAGDSLALADDPTAPAFPTAMNDACLVKINVGPGHAGPAGLASTSPGIGIEVWLPSPAKWTGRIRAHAQGGWMGDTAVASLTHTALPYIGAVGKNAQLATEQGVVTVIDDGGHQDPGAGASGRGIFAMNPDGSINTTLWVDLSYRSTHVMALVTKALVQSYYGRAADRTYFDGCSSSGRAAYQSAQMFPDDYDGILAGAPSIEQTMFFPSRQYGQVAMQRDLAGVLLTQAQIDLVSAAAVAACDTSVTGQHDGFISDVAGCKYDPTADNAVLCTASGGNNTTAACVSTVQAQVFNKIWYGTTTDGTVPAPTSDNGFESALTGKHVWWGSPRGAALPLVAGVMNGMPASFILVVDQLALNLQDPKWADPTFTNPTGNGQDAWKGISYADFAAALPAGKALNDPQFGNIDALNYDLTPFKAAGKKMITYMGLADIAVPPSSDIRYYENSTAVEGGLAAYQGYHRMFMVPGMGHCVGVGSPTPGAQPPIVTVEQMFPLLTAWVENGTAPTQVIGKSPDTTVTRPVCPYPAHAVYNGSGDVKSASSYTCSSN